MLLNITTVDAVLYFNYQTYSNSKEETKLETVSYPLLGIIINNSKNLSELSMIEHYLDSSQKCTFFKSMIKSQFNYRPELRMICLTI